MGEHAALSEITAPWSSNSRPKSAIGDVLRLAAARAGDASGGTSGAHREAEGVAAREWSLLQTVPITPNGTDLDTPNARDWPGMEMRHAHVPRETERPMIAPEPDGPIPCG